MSATSSTTSSPDTARYWDAVAERSAPVIQRCASCGSHQFYPTSVCMHCQGRKLEFITVAGPATVVSWTRVHRAPSDEFRDEVPYIVALVQVEEGPVMMCRADDDVTVGSIGRVEMSGTTHGGRPSLRFLVGQTKEKRS